MLVGVDICNTICNVNYELIQRFNIDLRNYPAKVSGDFFVSPEGLKLFMKARPYYQASTIINKIYHGGNSIMYVTSRPKISKFVTRRWLEINDFPPGVVEFVQSHEKAVIVQKYQMAAFFEDDPSVIKDLLRLGGLAILVKDAPYNKQLNGSKLLRFKEWGHLGSCLKQWNKCQN